MTPPRLPPTLPSTLAFPAVIERDPPTSLSVGRVPGFSGAHSRGETLDELPRHLQEVITILLENGEHF